MNSDGNGEGSVVAQCKKAAHTSQPFGALAQAASGAVEQYAYGPHAAQKAGTNAQSTGGAGGGGGETGGDGGNGDGGGGATTSGM